MDKPDPQATLDARHRTKTNKTKQKQKQNKNATQNMRKG
jgi:hypothetical protein